MSTPRFLKQLRAKKKQMMTNWKQMRATIRKIGCNPWRPLIIFDVGANDGSSFEALHKCLPWTKIYAFEPTPELVNNIRAKLGHSRNYHLIPKAVGEIRGHADFNVAGQSDWGCSSLLEFSDGLDRSWPGRTDFVVTQRTKVEIIRLDDFVREHKISHIDFLHIDTQGTDLNVLRSLGDEIQRVRSGVIEVPQSRDVMLYKNQHTREDAMEFFAQKGFCVWKIESQMNEDNLFFRRKDLMNGK